MQELFKQLFKKYNIPDKQIEEFSANFSLIAILKLVGATESRFSEEEKLAVKKALQNENLEQVEKLILSKYSSEEFNQTLEKYILPLFESYRKQVVA